MKKLITILAAIIFTCSLSAQSPHKLSYQAVIRNSSGTLITASPIGMRISILQGSSSGSAVYVETHTPSTNTNGLVSVEIGAGTIVSGSFSAINWSAGPYFIKSETDPTGGTVYAIIGTSELLSVPYALHAKTAESITGSITETDPVFVASPANGITSTDITNWNNKLSSEVDGSISNEIQALSISNDTIYLSSGGYVKLPAGFDGDYNSLTNKPTNVSVFANDAGYLTSFTEVDGSVSNEIQTLSRSNDTIYLSNGGYVKLPTGFNGDYNSLTNKPTNVSVFTNDAGYLTSFTEVDGSVSNEIQALSISNDTIYLSNGGFVKLPSTNAWSLNGNAGISSTTNFIGTTDNMPLNFRINNQKAGRLEAGSNAFFGYEAGLNFTGGADNTGVGYKALAATNSSSGNTAIGSFALASNTSDRNTAIGFGTMQNNVTGQWNTAIGSAALITNNSGSHNTAIGGTALQGNISGAANVALGYGALIDHQSGDVNTCVGMYSFKGNLNGFSNVGLGFESGYNNVSGSGNIFIGYRSGYNETGSNKLYIANSNTTTPLIYGDFANGKIGLGTTTPTYKLEVTDDASFNGVRVGAGGGGNFQNAVLGYQALQSNTSGYFNTAIGYQVMFPNTTGIYNTAVGTAALGGNTTGSQNCAFGYASLVTRSSNVDNTAFGNNSLRFGTSGDRNSAFGSSALLNNSGSNNTAIGFQSGNNNYNGSGNVFLGYQAGYNETGSNKLYIANSNTVAPLIYGDFSSGDVGIGTITPSAKLHVLNAGTSFGGYFQITNSSNTLNALLASTNGPAAAMSAANTCSTAAAIRDGVYSTVSGTGGAGTSNRAGYFSATGAATNYACIFDQGNVGIGTTSPTSKLHVVNSGTTFGGYFQITNPANTLNALLASTNGPAAALSAANTCATAAAIRDGVYVTVSGAGGAGTSNRAGYFSATGAGSNFACIFDQGNVGIGTINPTAKLEVNGSVKITGGTASQFLKADGSLDANTYLTAIVEVADEFSATASQTSFALTQTPSTNSKVKMYVNGIRVSNTAYSLSGTTLTYIPANNGSYTLSAGDRIQFDYYY